MKTTTTTMTATTTSTTTTTTKAARTASIFSFEDLLAIAPANDVDRRSPHDPVAAVAVRQLALVALAA